MSDEADLKPNPTGVMAATNLCVAVVLAASAILAGAQISDHFGWGAVGIVMVWGPVVNCILLIVFVALTPLVENMGQGASVKWYVAVAVLLPWLSYLASWFRFSYSTRRDEGESYSQTPRFSVGVLNLVPFPSIGS